MDDLVAKMKIQYVDLIPKHLHGQVGKLLESRNERGVLESVCEKLELKHLLSRDIDQLSGGELQRVAIILALGKPANIYLIDEPSAYLDSEQRIVCARVVIQNSFHT
mgnify:CR=1 FL=1